MATGSWLKTHRKSVITHTLIVGAFLLFLLFLAEPLFDRLERVEGGAKLCDITLPNVTNNITYAFDKFDVQPSVITVMGWAFIDGQDAVNNQVYLVFKSDSDVYIFDTVCKLPRGDVANLFKKLGIDVTDSGFSAEILLRKFENGKYTVGIYIKSDNLEALQYTDRHFTK